MATETNRRHNNDPDEHQCEQHRDREQDVRDLLTRVRITIGFAGRTEKDRHEKQQGRDGCEADNQSLWHAGHGSDRGRRAEPPQGRTASIPGWNPDRYCCVVIDVLLAEDQALLRDGFRAIVDADPDMQVVGEAGDGAEAVSIARRQRPDVVVMDVRMPVMDGITATRHITDAQLPCRVLILTTFDEDELVAGALRAGAAGFLLKSAAGRNLVEAIKAIDRGEALLAPEITRRLFERLVLTTNDAAKERTDQLTTHEREVLAAIGRGMSNNEIADALFLGVSTVKSHVNTLFAKLGVRDRAQAVVVAYESGLVQVGRP